jgi:hypothetical protein
LLQRGTKYSVLVPYRRLADSSISEARVPAIDFGDGQARDANAPDPIALNQARPGLSRRLDPVHVGPRSSTQASTASPTVLLPASLLGRTVSSAASRSASRFPPWTVVLS